MAADVVFRKWLIPNQGIVALYPKLSPNGIRLKQLASWIHQQRRRSSATKFRTDIKLK